MNTPTWMRSDLEPTRARRTTERRVAGRRPSVVTLMAAGALVTWLWVAFEIARLYLH
jgi:hypothetical protein